MISKTVEPLDLERGAPRAKPHAPSESLSMGRHPLVWILVLGAVARIVLWFVWMDYSVLLNDDARDYQGLATRLAMTGAYSSASGELISLRPPLFPAIVAATYKIAGVGNDGVVRAVQACVSLLTALIVYRLGTLVYDQRVGLWAAAIACFYPALLAYSNVLLSEIWFTFFAVAFAWLVLEAVQRDSLPILIAAGVVLALAALTRSIMLLFVPVLVLYLVWFWPGSWRRRVAAAALPAIVFGLIIAPWAVRNTRLQQTISIIDVMGGRNAMMGNYEFTPMERSWATISTVGGDQAWFRVLARERQGAQVTQGQLDKQALRHAIRYVTAHPMITLKRDIVKFFNFWQLERTFVAAAANGYFGNTSRAAIGFAALLFCGSFAVIAFAAIFGAICTPPRNLRDQVFLLASILFPCMIHSLIFAHERYRLPVMPLMFVYAAAAFVDWREIWNRRRSWGFGIAILFCVLLVGGWMRELLMVDLKLVEQFNG